MAKRKDLTITKCGNGELVFENLAPCDLEIPGENVEELKTLSAEGRLWPYKVVLKSYDKRRDVWLAKIVEA